MKDSVNHPQFWLFTALFGALYFLLFILTENFSSLWITPFFLLLYALTFSLLCWNSKERITRPLWRTIMTLTSLFTLFFIVTPFAVSVPEAVYRWVTLALAGLSAVFFLGTPIIDHSEQKFTDVLIFIHAAFLPLNLIIFFCSTLKTLTPDGSILNFTVGQNHAYILYLIALPMCVEHLKKHPAPLRQSWKWIVLSIAFALGTLLSFSRVGILLLIVELLYLLVTNSDSLSTQLKRFLWILSAGVTVCFTAFLVFTLTPELSFGTNCRTPLFQEQLCKSFSSDHRVDYWREALRGIEASPVIGNGGGSFSAISLRYRRTMTSYTAYPHSEYIQLVSEFGIFGLIFGLGYLGSLAISWKNFSRLNEHTKVLLFISSVLAVDSCFNFNWSFPGILLAEAIIWAMMFRQVLKTISLQKTSTNLRILALPITLLSLPLLWFSVAFMTAEITSGSSVEKYMTTFPYISWKAQQALLSPDTSATVRSQTEKLYRNDEALVRISAEREINPQKQFDAYQHLKKVDPLNPQVHVKSLILATQVNQPDVVLDELHWLTSFYEPQELYSIRNIEPAYLDRLIAYATQLAEVNPELAADITLLAYCFEPWRINEVKTNFLITPSKYSDESIVKLLDSFPPHILWSYLPSLDAWTWEKITVSGTTGDWEKLQIYSRLMLQHSDWYPSVQWTYLSQIFKNHLENVSHSGSSTAIKKTVIVDAWRETLETIRKFGKVADTSLDTTEFDTQINSTDK